MVQTPQMTFPERFRLDVQLADVADQGSGFGICEVRVGDAPGLSFSGEESAYVGHRRAAWVNYLVENRIEVLKRAP